MLGFSLGHFFYSTILSSISSSTTFSSFAMWGAIVLVEWFSRGHYLKIMLQTVMRYQLYLCSIHSLSAIACAYHNPMIYVGGIYIRVVKSILTAILLTMHKSQAGFDPPR